MTNYMRHVTAGFLIEYLNFDWRHGQLWYHDTLVDADVAIQAMMWQNGGHSGMDQWNFVMHPVFAAKSCDPEVGAAAPPRRADRPARGAAHGHRAGACDS